MNIIFRGNTPLLDVSNYEIVEFKGFYSYISHKDKLASPGFGYKDSLIKYKSDFLATEKALEIAYYKYNDIISKETT